MVPKHELAKVARTGEKIGVEVFESATKPMTTLGLFWSEIKSDVKALIGLIIVFTIIMFSIIGSAIITTDVATQVDLINRRQPPSWTENGDERGGILGTDDAGRDMFQVLVIATRNSLFIGFTVAIISIFIGVVVGIIAGFYGGHTDNVIMRLVDTWSMLPATMFIIALIQLSSQFTMWRFILFLVMFTWMARSRLMRGMALQQRSMDYVHASKTLGTSNIVIIFREVMPNLVSIISANVVITMSGSIGMETGLSLLGFGLPAGTPSLGNILGNAVNPANLEHRWWMWFPAVAIMFVMMMSINFLGQAVTRAADPKQRAI